MKRIKRIVTVTFEYDNASEAWKHRRMMEADGWTARITDKGDALTNEYVLLMPEEDAI